MSHALYSHGKKITSWRDFETNIFINNNHQELELRIHLNLFISIQVYSFIFIVFNPNPQTLVVDTAGFFL